LKSPLSDPPLVGRGGAIDRVIAHDPIGILERSNSSRVRKFYCAAANARESEDFLARRPSLLQREGDDVARDGRGDFPVRRMADASSGPALTWWKLRQLISVIQSEESVLEADRVAADVMTVLMALTSCRCVG
jgi:hypothetical protein